MSESAGEVERDVTANPCLSLGVLVFVAILGMSLLTTATQVGESAWVPNLRTGQGPLAVVAIPGGVATVCRGPHSATLGSLRAELGTKLAGATGAAVKVLTGVQNELAAISTVMTFTATPEGAFWPHREYLLYELSQITVPAESPPERAEKAAGTPLATASMRKGTSDIVLVATTEGLFELDLPAGTLRFYRPDDPFPSGVICMAAGDITGDGQQELVVVSKQLVSVFRIADAKFSLWSRWKGGPGGVLGFEPSYVTIADLNADGAGDIIVANSGEATVTDETGLVRTYRDLRVHVILSRRTGFANPQSFEATARPRSIAVADFSGDGYLDVAVAGAEEVVVLKGNGDGTLKPRQVIARDFPNNDFSIPPAALAAADLNGDRNADLILAAPKTGEVTIHWGPLGTDRFRSVEKLERLERPVEVLTRDVDSDGYLELLIVDERANELVVFVQHRGGFSRLPNPSQGHGAAFLAAGGQGSPSSLLLAVPSDVLRVERKANLELETKEFPRPPGLPSDWSTTVKSLYYTFYDRSPPSVDTLVARGDALGGVPVRTGESPDGSLAVVFDRSYTGFRPADEVPPRSSVSGAFPRTAVFGDVSPETMLDILVTFADGTVKAAQSPWPKRTASRAISLPPLPSAVSVAAAAFADLNKDGTDDLVLVDRATADVYVALKATTPWVRYTGSGRSPVALISADLDADGRLDVAIANAFSNDVTIFWGEGDGTLVRHKETIPVGPRPRGVAAAPIAKGASEVALIVTNAAADSVSVLRFRGKSPDVVVDLRTVPVGGKGPLAIASARSLDWLAEAPADDFADFIVACYASDELVLLRGKGGGEFHVSSLSKARQVSNILATPVTVRDGYGPTSVVVADFDGDGVEDVAFSVAFPTSRLAPSGAVTYDSAVRTFISGLWQDAFFFRSGGTRPPPVGQRILDVTLGRAAGTNALAVLSVSTSRPTLATVVSWNAYGRVWEVVTQIPLDSGASALRMVDLDSDRSSDFVVLKPTANRLEVLWGPAYDKATVTSLRTTPAPAGLAVGTSVEATWIAAGGMAWVWAPPAQARRQPPVVVELNLDGGYTLQALAVPKWTAPRAPPDLVLLTYRPRSGREEIRIFRGADLALSNGRAPQVWEMPNPVSAIAAGDLDLDGLTDVVVAYPEKPIGHVWLATGARLDLPSIGIDCTGLAVGDLTGDRIPDVVALNTKSPTRVTIFQGNGNGSFARQREELLLDLGPRDGSAQRYVLVGDVDNDERSDVLVYTCKQDQIMVLATGDLPDEHVMGGVRLLARLLPYRLLGLQ